MPLKVIFSDLDGTLLDPADYSFEPARPMLGVIKSNNVPLVLCSSKTRTEIENYRHRMENEHPFISENGGGIFIPQNYFTVPFNDIESEGYQIIKLGIAYEEIRSRFIKLREKYGAKVRGFGDMTPSEIAILTGLSPEESILAKQRDFEEPFVFEGKPDKNFLHAIEEDACSCRSSASPPRPGWRSRCTSWRAGGSRGRKRTSRCAPGFFLPAGRTTSTWCGAMATTRSRGIRTCSRLRSSTCRPGSSGTSNGRARRCVIFSFMRDGWPSRPAESAFLRLLGYAAIFALHAIAAVLIFVLD